MMDPDIREVFHILLDNNRERRLKRIVPKELVGLEVFNTKGCNFDNDTEETTNKVMTVVNKIKNVKREGLDILKEKYQKSKNKKNIEKNNDFGKKTIEV